MVSCSLVNAIRLICLWVRLCSVLMCIKWCRIHQHLAYTDSQWIYLPLFSSRLPPIMFSNSSLATWIFLLHYIYKFPNILKPCKNILSFTPKGISSWSKGIILKMILLKKFFQVEWQRYKLKHITHLFHMALTQS